MDDESLLRDVGSRLDHTLDIYFFAMGFDLLRWVGLRYFLAGEELQWRRIWVRGI